MNMKTMTASVASKEFGRFLDTAQREPVIVTKKNRPVAVTVSVHDWDVMQQLLIERGVSQGLEDISARRYETLTEASADKRIARFKARNQAEV